MTDPTVARLCREMEDSTTELVAATQRLCSSDPQPFVSAMAAVQHCCREPECDMSMVMGFCHCVALARTH